MRLIKTVTSLLVIATFLMTSTHAQTARHAGHDKLAGPGVETRSVSPSELREATDRAIDIVSRSSRESGRAAAPDILWHYDLNAPSYGSAAVADIDEDGKLEIVFGTYFNDEHIYALNAESGTLLWSFDTGGCNDASPAIADVDLDGDLEVVVPASSPCEVHCLSGATGAVEWSTPTANPIDSPPAVADVDNDDKPEVVFGTWQGHVICLNGEDGSQRWQADLGAASAIQSEPSIADLDQDGQLDVVVAQWAGDNRVYALKGDDGSVLWYSDAPQDYMYHGPSIADIDEDGKPEVVLGCYDNHVYVISGEDGSPLWDYPTTFYAGAPTSVADLDNDDHLEIVFAAHDTLGVLSHTGGLVWSHTTGGSIFRGAAISDVNGDDVLDVVFGSADGILRALRGSDGQVVWTYDLGNHYGNVFDMDHAPVIGDFDNDGKLDVFVIGGYGVWPPESNHGRAYALTAGDGTGPGWPMFRHDLVHSGTYSAGQPIIYVDDDAPLGGDGASWETAFKYLQDALAIAAAGDEIHVAQGTYKPDQDEGGSVTAGERTETFHLITDVALFGGYAGLGAPNPNDQDIEAYETILSGDIGITSDYSDNSYHVVYSGGPEESGAIDGFTITGSYASYSDFGGGMYNAGSSPTVANCTFTGNSGSSFSGGAMYNINSSPTVINCTFTENGASGFSAGAMYNTDSSPTVSNCTFSGNSSYLGCGGMYNSSSNPTVTNCIFMENNGGNGGGMCNTSGNPTVANCIFTENGGGADAGGGGGMSNSSSSPIVRDCAFSNNSAYLFGGGGMYNGYNSSPTVINCAFDGNSADMYGGGMYNEDDSNPTVTNCTFSGNSADHGSGMHNNDSSPTVTHCAFNGNSTDYFGGGMYNAGGNPTVIDCTFTGNSGNIKCGGGMYNKDTNPLVINCVFSYNSALFGAGMYNSSSNPAVSTCTFNSNSANLLGGGMYNGSSDPTVTNSIFWGNVGDADGDAGGPFIDESAQIHTVLGAPVVTHSCVQDDDPSDTVIYPGTGNIDDDPLFVDADGPDDIPGTEDDNLRLTDGSPCIDAGDNAAVTVPTDLDRHIRVVDGNDDGTATVDMGAYEYLPDCNQNGLPDECDIDCGVEGGACDLPGCGQSNDCDENGVPDECECGTIDPPTQPAGEAGFAKNRYLSFAPANVGCRTALRVRVVDVPDDFDYLEGLLMWVGPPEEFCENSGQDVPPPGGCGPAWTPDGPASTMWAAQLQCDPYYTDWGVADAIHVYHEVIVPGGTYTIEALDEACDEAVEANYSDPLTVNTSKWGDVCGPWDSANSRWTGPDGPVDIVYDITACVEKFANRFGAPIKARADIDPGMPEQKINITSDVTSITDAFGGDPYPFAPDPNPCPSQAARISEYSNSGCLPGSAGRTAGSFPCGDDQIELSAEPGTLRVAHRDATYNCCADDIVITLSVDGPLLHLSETEYLTDPCYCVCCYNVEATVVGLAPGLYSVSFCWADYETTQDECYVEHVVIP